MHVHRPDASTAQATSDASPLVLLLVDVINPLDFPEAPRLEKAALDMASRLAALKRHLAAHRVVTVYANDHYGAWHSEFRDVKARCEAKGGVAARLANMLAPQTDDYVILKPRHSAFYGTPLDLLLDHLGCQRLIIGGLSTDICVQMSAGDAYLRGFGLWVPEDCSAAESPQRHAHAMAYMQRVFKAETRAFGAEQAQGLPDLASLAIRRTT